MCIRDRIRHPLGAQKNDRSNACVENRFSSRCVANPPLSHYFSLENDLVLFSISEQWNFAFEKIATCSHIESNDIGWRTVPLSLPFVIDSFAFDYPVKRSQLLPFFKLKVCPLYWRAGLVNDFDFQFVGPLKSNFLRLNACLLYTSPSPRDRQKSRMPSSA